jgi:ribose 5-phosphate isomerase A
MNKQDNLEWKSAIARVAAASVRSGIRLGLGSGSTVKLIVEALGERVRAGTLTDLRVIAASTGTERAMAEAGIALNTLDEYPELDLAIDGADEVDPRLAMIKGGGGNAPRAARIVRRDRAPDCR